MSRWVDWAWCLFWAVLWAASFLAALLTDGADVLFFLWCLVSAGFLGFSISEARG